MLGPKARLQLELIEFRTKGYFCFSFGFMFVLLIARNQQRGNQENCQKRVNSRAIELHKEPLVVDKMR